MRRYQLGIPVWRALGGLTQMEIEGVNYIHASDRTAVFLDARDPQEFSAGSLNGARNTRIVVFSRDGTQSRLVAEAVVSEAFHNVMFFDGPFATIKAATR